MRFKADSHLERILFCARRDLKNGMKYTIKTITFNRNCSKTSTGSIELPHLIEHIKQSSRFFNNRYANNK